MPGGNNATPHTYGAAGPDAACPVDPGSAYDGVGCWHAQGDETSQQQ
jgi:hypothetical protein